MRIVSISLLILMQISFINAQEVERCAMTIQAHEQMMEENEEYRLHHQEWRKKLDKFLSQQGKNPSCTNGPILIPVAIHFDNGIVPAAQETCAIDVAVDQINEMNNEIAGLDADAPLINNFLSCFGAGILGDACIEFCIGQYNHPTGYGLVDGDYAVTFGQVNFNVPSGNYTPVNADWNEYINIYVDDLPGGLLGVSNGIPGNFNGDGVLVDNCVFGTGNISCPGVSFTGASGCYTLYDEGETTAHELGHYLGLYHIWGDNSGCSGSQDMIADTPNMSSSYSGYTGCVNDFTCADLPVTCSSEDMYMNFMSYASDGCMYMFTSDQSDVMNGTAVGEGFTTVSSKCTPPPIAEFIPDTDIVLCDVDCVDFTDQSINSPDSWNWTFTVQSGDIVLDISTSTDQNPTVCVESGTSGSVEIELDVSNITGNDVEVKILNFSFGSGNTYYADMDGDSYGDPNNSMLSCQVPVGYVTDNSDCDDTDDTVYPGAFEFCDGVDNNCDGDTDEECECDGDYLTINTITEEINRAQFTIMSDAVVNTPQDILFTAGDFIEFESGFEVVSGTNFLAMIDDCAVMNADDDDGDEVFRMNEMDIESFSNSVLEEFKNSKTIDFKILDKNGVQMIAGECKPTDLTAVVRDQSLIASEIYFLVLSDQDTKSIKKILFRP